SGTLGHIAATSGGTMRVLRRIRGGRRSGRGDGKYMSTASAEQRPGGVAPAARTGNAGECRAPVQRTDSPSPADLPGPDLSALLLTELRALRRDAQRDEADLSYVRRLLQGRIDILRAELARRGGRIPEGVVNRLPEILRDAPARNRSSARHVTVGTPHGEEY